MKTDSPPPRDPRVLGLHARPRGAWRWGLAIVPFVLALLIYGFASSQRHADNPNDKLLPYASQMADAAVQMAFKPEPRSGQYLMWRDTLSSLRRLAIGLLVASALGLGFGLYMGVFPGLRVLLTPFVTFLSMVPPLAVLPILFISFGVDELAKVVLIVFGIAPVITRDVLGAAQRIPREQITKALTLGASPMKLATHIVLPQIAPRLLESLRLSLGPAWLFLIAAEAIAADDGLGYRIFLVRRYLAMDVILPYVLWITLLGFLMDLGLRVALRRGFGWYVAGETK